MQLTHKARECSFGRAQPAVTVLQRSMRIRDRCSRLQHPQRTEQVVASAYTAISQAGRPSSPDPQQDIRMTARQQVGHQTVSAEQMQDQQLFLAKVWNFLLGASGVFLIPYIPIFLQSRGMSSSQIGLLAALRPWLAAPVGMTVSALADKHKAHAKLLLMTAALGILLRSILPLAGGGVVLMALLLAGELVGAPTGVLGDATVLSNCKDPGDCGKQRQWGSIGFGLLSIPAGYIIQRMGVTSAFAIYGMASIPLLMVASKMRYKYGDTVAGSSRGSQDIIDLPAAQVAETSSTMPVLDQKEVSSASAKDSEPSSAQELLMQPAVLLFLWRCLLAGFGFGVMGSYTFLYLKGLGAPETLMGLALMASVCTEVPAFMFQGAILKHLSASALLNVALVATALRLAAYAALPRAGNVWAVLPVELLHGITFGIFFCTATVYSSKLAPPRLSATMQGMFQSTYAGVGAGLGGLVGGVLMDKLGGQGLFAIAAAFVAAGCVLGLVAERAVYVLQRPQGTEVTRLKLE